jgi:1,4-alpha-glucan branching enzyme
MPGDAWQQFANLRLMLGYMYTHPGKKLLFMGGEFGQRQEWYHEESLHWHLLEDPMHAGLARWVRELNLIYRYEPSLHAGDFEQNGFSWIDCSDAENSVISYQRRVPEQQSSDIVVVCNNTPVPRANYRIGAPRSGFWREALNSDAREYGGSGHGNMGGVRTSPVPCHGYSQSLVLHLPPLAMIILKHGEK